MTQPSKGGGMIRSITEFFTRVPIPVEKDEAMGPTMPSTPQPPATPPTTQDPVMDNLPRPKTPPSVLSPAMQLSLPVRLTPRKQKPSTFAMSPRPQSQPTSLDADVPMGSDSALSSLGRTPSMTPQPTMDATTQDHSPSKARAPASAQQLGLPVPPSSSLSAIGPTPGGTQMPGLGISTQGRSKRVDIKGRSAVLDSDEDSDDSLPDITFLPPPPKPKPQISAVKETFGTKRMVDGKAKINPTKSNGLSVEDLLAKKRADRARLERLAAIDKKLNDDTSASVTTSRSNKVDVSDEVLEACMDAEDDEDKAEKIKRTKASVQRIEALNQNATWYFFAEEIPDPQSFPFPKSCLGGKNIWADQLGGSKKKRNAAFKSGFVARLAPMKALPQELLQWLMNRLTDEEEDDLSLAYLDVLEASTTQFPNPLTPQILRELFTLAGAKPVGTNLLPVVPEYRLPDAAERGIHFNIQWIIELVRRLAPSMNPGTAECGMELLIRVGMDDTIRRNIDLRLRIEAALSALITSFSPSTSRIHLDRISTKLFNSIKHPSMRHLAIQALPAHPVQAHHFRRRLALAFVLDTTRFLQTPFCSDSLNSHVFLCLQSRAFTITPETDYACLSSNLRLLDVAIDEGFGTLPPRTAHPTFRKAAKTKFNQQIDMLAKTITHLQSTIVSNGANHLSRLVARNAAEMVSTRLKLCVRTEPPPPKDHFAVDDGKQKRLEDFFSFQQPVDMGPVPDTVDGADEDGGEMDATEAGDAESGDVQM